MNSAVQTEGVRLEKAGRLSISNACHFLNFFNTMPIFVRQLGDGSLPDYLARRMTWETTTSVT
jgi:hypothetical protein